jgi:hypothetical protein
VGASTIDRQDDVFHRERHPIALIQAFVELRNLGEVPRRHEAPHHATVLELVPDMVCVVWVGFLEEPLKVVRGRPRLTLVAMYGGRDVPHTKAAPCHCHHRGRSWSWALDGAACTSFCRP